MSEAIPVAFLLAALGWTIFCLGGLPAETRVVTAALVTALLCVHLLVPTFSRGGLGRRCDPLSAAILPFLAYAALNVLLVCPVRWLGWRDWLDWAQMAAVFWVVVNGIRGTTARRVLFWMVVAMALVAVLLAAYQRGVDPHWMMLGRSQAPQFLTRSSGPFGIPNSLAALLILLTPALVGCALQRGVSTVQRVVCGYLALVLVAGLVLTISRGAWFALAAALLVWSVVGSRSSLVRRGLTALAVVVALALVWVGLKTEFPAVQHRIDALVRDHGETSRPYLWRGAWAIFREHPAWGGGAGSFNVLFEAQRPEGFRDEPLWAHNEYLNTASDYGVAGMLLAAAGAGAIVVGVRRRARAAEPDLLAASPSLRRRSVTTGWSPPPAALATGMAAFALQCGVDFNLKVPALALCAATVAGLWVNGSREADPEIPTAPHPAWLRAIGASLAITIAIGALAWVLPQYRAEALRVRARRAIDAIAVHALPRASWSEIYRRSEAELRRAVTIDRANATAWSDLSYVTSLTVAVDSTRRDALTADALQAADRALAESDVVPEFWMRRGIALDLSGKWFEAGRSLVRALQLAPASLPVWYATAVHLSVETNDPGRAMSAVDFCLRLDPSNHEAQALRQRLIDRNRAP